MDIGYIKKAYKLNHRNEQILARIQHNLQENNVDNIKIEDNVIYFKNHLIGKRSNVSLMAAIDSGFFKLVEGNECNTMIVMFSVKRILLFWIIAAICIFIVNSNNLLIALAVNAFLFGGIFVSIVRYKLFVDKIVQEFRIRPDRK